jgi:hypothetical protein
MLVLVSLQCSLIQYRFGTAHVLGLVENYCLPWHWASESASEVPNCEHVITPATCSDIMSWSPLQKDLTPRVFPLFSQCTEFPLDRGFKLMSSRSGVRCSDQMAS